MNANLKKDLVLEVELVSMKLEGLAVNVTLVLPESVVSIGLTVGHAHRTILVRTTVNVKTLLVDSYANVRLENLVDSAKLVKPGV